MLKFWAFIIITILWLNALCQDIDDKGRGWDITLLVVMYFIFILISLYELGKEEK